MGSSAARTQGFGEVAETWGSQSRGGVCFQVAEERCEICNQEVTGKRGLDLCNCV